MLDPHRMTVFRSVVATGSVQVTADLLLMTSSAVSQHLSALSKETGLTLFRRAGRGIVPTEAALRLNQESDEAMAQWSRLDQVVTDLREGRLGRLSIGYYASTGPAWLPTLAKRLTAEIPGLVLELVIKTTEERRFAAEDPRRFGVDIDIDIQPPDAPTDKGGRRVELLKDPFVAVVPQGHPLAGSSRIALGDLRRETLVSNDQPTSVGHRLVVAAFNAAGIRPRFTVQSQDYSTAIAFVAAGMGVSIVPRLATRELPQGVVRIPLAQPTPVRHLVALVRDQGAPHPAAERALELLTELIQHPASHRGG